MLRVLPLLLALAAQPAAAQVKLQTDVNIVTGLDISGSVSDDDIAAGIHGVAATLRSAAVQRAFTSGTHGRVGFYVFAWHRNAFPKVIDWTIISNAEEAATAAATVEKRLAINIEMEARAAQLIEYDHNSFYYGRLTDLSQAIDHAAASLKDAPFESARGVINIIGNGADNVGEEAERARDRAVATGHTINGVVIGLEAEAVAYYRQDVIGGPGAFVMQVPDAASYPDVFERKFIGDVIAVWQP